MRQEHGDVGGKNFADIEFENYKLMKPNLVARGELLARGCTLEREVALTTVGIDTNTREHSVNAHTQIHAVSALTHIHVYSATRACVAKSS